MEKTDTPVDEMIARLDESVRSDIEELDSIIGAEMSGLTRVLWEGKMWGGTDQRIIGYGDYSAKNSRGERVDWFMVGLAAQKKYLSVYVNAVEDGSYLADQYADRLGKIKRGASSISFRRVDEIDLDVFREMIARARDLMVSDS